MMWVYGTNPVAEFLRDCPELVDAVFLTAQAAANDAQAEVKDRVKPRGIPVTIVEPGQINRWIGAGCNHQGVLARVKPLPLATVDQLLEPPGRRLLVALDEVQDPHNLGAIARTALAFGAAGLVIPRHRSAGVSPGALKASAGALARLPVCEVPNLAQFLARSKNHGFWTFGAAGDGECACPGVDWGARVVIVMGSEADGLRRNIRQVCDHRVAIATSGVESLNVSVAFAVLAFDWARQGAGAGAGPRTAGRSADGRARQPT